MTIDIVPIREEHIESYNQAVDSVARERQSLGAFEGFPLEATHQFVMTNIEKDHPQFVALDGDKVIGWVDVIPKRSPVMQHGGELGIGIIDGYRGQGIGQRLMQAVLDKAKAIGLKRVALSVYEHNEAGISLYLKFGFEVEGRRSRAAKLDKGYVDLIEMGLWIGD